MRAHSGDEVVHGLEGRLALDREGLGDDVGHLRGVDELGHPVADLAGEAIQEPLRPLLDVADHRRGHEMGEEQIVPGGDVVPRDAACRPLGIAGVESVSRGDDAAPSASIQPARIGSGASRRSSVETDRRS